MKPKFFVFQLNLCAYLLILSMSLVISSHALAKKNHKKKPRKGPPVVLTLTASQLFVEAEKNFEMRNWSKFENKLSKLTNYPLYPYLLHKKLSHEISQHTAKSTDVNAFIHQYPDSSLSKQLAYQWLALQANQKNWKNYLALYEEPVEEEKDHKYECHALWAKYQSHSALSELYPAIRFWDSGLPQAQSCEKIFEELLTQNKLGYLDIWNRIEQALKEKQISVAESTAKYLSFEDKKIFRLWIKIYTHPYLIANKLFIDLDEYNTNQLPLIHKMITYGMSRLIKQDVIYATRLYPEILERYALSSNQQEEIAKKFAISLAKKRNPLAEKWFIKVEPNSEDPEYLAWKIRYALFKEDWNEALNTISYLPLVETKQPRWQYWKARALDASGQKSQALTLFQNLFHERHYYGFLAHRYCKHPLKHDLNLPQAKIMQENLNQFHHDPSIVRIKELLKLSRIQQAKREWSYKVSLLTEEQKLEAAEYAHHMQWYDLAMSTLSKTQNDNALIFRFPLAHHPKIIHEATKNAIDPAWVFAVTRQESAFIPYAQSPVGAMGLMQLMPRTAQEVAKTLKKHYTSKQALSNPNLNIELGTAYLKNLHGFMQHNPVLATASYNAGPGRIKEWLPPSTMAADIWIENIPFEETRDYVQNVITYTGIYRGILGNKLDLENLLPDIMG